MLRAPGRASGAPPRARQRYAVWDDGDAQGTHPWKEGSAASDLNVGTSTTLESAEVASKLKCAGHYLHSSSSSSST